METKTEFEWKKAQILYSTKPIFEKQKCQKLMMHSPILGLNNKEVNSSYPEFADKKQHQ